MLDHDRYYRDRNDLRLEERAALNYDHPDALETDLMVRARAGVEGGSSRCRCRATISRATRGWPRPRLFTPRRAIIVEGILVFTDAALRELMDIKVFVDTDSDTRFIRRLQRDVAERGRTMESVIDQYQGTVKPMHLEFVEPSKRYADVIIPLGGHNTVAVDLLLTLLRSVVGCHGRALSACAAATRGRGRCLTRRSIAVEEVGAERGQAAGEHDRADQLEQVEHPGDADAERRPLHPPVAGRGHQVDDEQHEQDQRSLEQEADGSHKRTYADA